MSGILSFLWSHLDWTTFSVGLLTFYVVKYLIFHGYHSTKNLPPGLFGFPLIGVLPYFLLSKKRSCEVLEDLHKKYGPIIRFDTIGTMVSGTKAVKELFLNDDLLGRPQQQFGVKELDEIFDKSVMLAEGELWKKHRRFSLYTLRDLGFGKTARMEEYLQEELKEFISILEKQNGEAFDAQDILVSSTSNNISTLMFGERLPFEHPKRKQLNKSLTAFIEKVDQFVAVSIIPGVTKIMAYLDIGIIKIVKKSFLTLKNITEDYIKEHLANLDKENPKDYIDHYLIQSEKDPHFSHELAVGNTTAFFNAGSATVRIAVEYLIHFMASRPDIQDKVFDEINRVVGVNREVTWADAKDLPYTNAVITERHRHFSVAAFGVQRRSLKDTTLCGYDIPAGTVLIYNLDSVNFDPQTFPDPYEFKPERFLDEQGNLCNLEKVWAFALGKRACPGESFAVLETFLYFANLIQRFKLEPEDPTVGIKLKPPRSLIQDVIRQKIRYIPRK